MKGQTLSDLPPKVPLSAVYTTTTESSHSLGDLVRVQQDGVESLDFASLIELITTIVAPATWDEAGSPGSIQAFRSKSALAISQTADMREAIVGLIEVLRGLPSTYPAGVRSGIRRLPPFPSTSLRSVERPGNGQPPILNVERIMGAHIRTVLKDYAPQELAGAATLFHEHLSFADDFMTRWMAFYVETRAANAGGSAKAGAAGGQGDRRGGAPAGPFFMHDVELTSDEMRIAKTEGIGCAVDGGHPDMGRNVNFLRHVSMRSGMPIVAGGDFYTQPFYPKEIATMTEEQIVEALIKQVETDPIGAFGQIGSWDDITKDERKVFRAVGKTRQSHRANGSAEFTSSSGE